MLVTDQLPLPGLDAGVIDRLGRSWDDGGLWLDIERLADAVFARQGDRRFGFLWHHLVLAVGNFKRQPGRRLYPAPLSDRQLGQSPPRPDALVIPLAGGSLQIGRLDEETWAKLKHALRGAGVATVTTLLAALWPDQHIVFDWRVHAAANGLRLNAGMPTTQGVDPQGDRSVAITLDEYRTVRGWVVSQAGGVERPPVQVERSLYRLSQLEKLKLSKGKKRTWTTYGDLVGEAVTSIRPAPKASGHEGDEPGGS